MAPVSVDILAFSQHLLSFAAPALGVALLVSLAGRWVLPRGGARPAWRALFAIDFAVALAVLAGGLWFFGRDGKMATYAALVLAVGTSHFLAARGWRG